MRKLLPLLALALVLAGCGARTFDTKDLDRKLSAEVGRAVTCPDDQRAEKGVSFTCTTAGRDIAITVTDDDGGVDWKPR